MFDMSQFMEMDAFGPSTGKKPIPEIKQKISAFDRGQENIFPEDVSPVKKQLTGSLSLPEQKDLVNWLKENFIKNANFAFTMEPSKKRSPQVKNFNLYPLLAVKSLFDQIPGLLTEKKISYKDELGPRDQICARFVVTTQNNENLLSNPGKLLLAFEGKPNSITPGHKDMVPNKSAKAAGRAFWDKEKQRIFAFDNMCGGNRNPFATIVWPLAIVFSCQQQNSLLTDPVELRMADSAGGYMTAYFITFAQINDLLTLFTVSDMQLMEKNNLESSVVTIADTDSKSTKRPGIKKRPGLMDITNLDLAHTLPEVTQTTPKKPYPPYKQAQQTVLTPSEELTGMLALGAIYSNSSPVKNAQAARQSAHCNRKLYNSEVSSQNQTLLNTR